MPLGSVKESVEYCPLGSVESATPPRSAQPRPSVGETRMARTSPQLVVDGLRRSTLSELWTAPSELSGTLEISVHPLGETASDFVPSVTIALCVSVPLGADQSVVG